MIPTRILPRVYGGCHLVPQQPSKKCLYFIRPAITPCRSLELDATYYYRTSKAVQRVFHRRQFSSNSRDKRKTIDRDVLVSILESSPTRRDAKGYLQTYTNSLQDRSRYHPIPEPSPSHRRSIFAREFLAAANEPPHVAIVKVARIESTDNAVLSGLAKTISQLQSLGLLCVIVVDCGLRSSPSHLLEQAYRISQLIDALGKQKSLVFRDLFSAGVVGNASSDRIMGDITVSYHGPFRNAISQRVTPIIVPTCVGPDPLRLTVVDSDIAVITLTHYLSGSHALAASDTHPDEKAGKIALVERIILLDPLGALPLANRPGSYHRFVNLEQEFDGIVQWLDQATDVISQYHTVDSPASLTLQGHINNLKLARSTLSVLPATSSVLIMGHSAAAHMPPRVLTSSPEITSTVRTRVTQNPLIHNLLTDKPIYSSSLPARRIYPVNSPSQQQHIMTTLIKRGMPLSIYPDPRMTPWTPPIKGSSLPRLTDAQIDLARLSHLINDSFGRELDLRHYLARLDQNLAGVIIAGEYEGGAILTWECPSHPATTSPPYETQAHRYVPYLDKFAVLKSRQGSSGVADILFNAIIQDCFPDGLCWRSRHDNPVNKWYFERSLGSLRLDGSKWTMFWTTPGTKPGDQTLHDYEAVCRKVEPSWAKSVV